MDPRHRSRIVTDGTARAPARTMLRAVGFGDDGCTRPRFGVVAAANDLTPCNALDPLAAAAASGARAAGGVPMRFSAIAISDGIAMGHRGMRASRPSRDLIADPVGCVMEAEQLDAMVTIAGCDKSRSGMRMAAARLNGPAVLSTAARPSPVAGAASR